jgi:hypothetical protein
MMSESIEWQDLQLQSLDDLRNLVSAENVRQLNLWGCQTHSPTQWLSLLVKQVGELAEAINNHVYYNTPKMHIVREGIEVATLALKIVEMASKEGN